MVRVIPDRSEERVLSLMDDMDLEELDIKRLMEYSKRFDVVTVDLLKKSDVDAIHIYSFRSGFGSR